MDHSMQNPVSRECGRYEWAELQLRRLDLGGGAVLDLGCSNERMKPAVEAMGCKWIGYDKYPRHPEVQEWDLEEPFAADSSIGVKQPADGVLMLDVLEHLGNPWRAMRNISDRLASDGWLVMTVPNPCWSRSRLWALREGVPICFQRSDLELNRHVFTPWPHILEALLTENGLAIEVCETLDGRTRWPNWDGSVRYPIRWGVACALIWMERRDPWAMGMSYGVVARKKGGR
jgi:hypothetical protein